MSKRKKEKEIFISFYVYYKDGHCFGNTIIKANKDIESVEDISKIQDCIKEKIKAESVILLNYKEINK